MLNRAEVSSTVAESKSPVSDIKDKRIIPLLQTNSSKVVDENGEPKVAIPSNVVTPSLRAKLEKLGVPGAEDFL